MVNSNSFNLVELYQKAFGIKGVRFAIPPNTQNQKADIMYNGLSVSTPPSALAQSILGTPIYEQITLVNGESEYTFPDWPLIDIAYSKNIIKTPVKGRNGTIKEYINIDDYQITIRGILINYFSEEYPYDLLSQLQSFCVLNNELRVVSPVLNILDVHNLVITDVRYPEVEGFNHIQPFIIQCLSDEPVELIIKSAKNQNKIVQGL